MMHIIMYKILSLGQQSCLESSPVRVNHVELHIQEYNIWPVAMNTFDAKKHERASCEYMCN